MMTRANNWGLSREEEVDSGGVSSGVKDLTKVRAFVSKADAAEEKQVTQ
jgi:hypothetical protein